MVEPDGRGVAMLSFGEDGGLLTVTFGGELYLSRRIDVTLADSCSTPTTTASTPASTRSPSKCSARSTISTASSTSSACRAWCWRRPARSGLEEYLSSNLYTPVDDAWTWPTCSTWAARRELADAAAQQRFFLALGAALRHEEAVL